MAKTYREVAMALRAAGWRKVTVSGSHEKWLHSDGRKVTVPGAGKAGREVPTGTLASIRRSTGLGDLR